MSPAFWGVLEELPFEVNKRESSLFDLDTTLNEHTVGLGEVGQCQQVYPCQLVDLDGNVVYRNQRRMRQWQWLAI